MNYGTQRKSGAILSYVSIIASTVVQLIYTPFLIRMLGQSEYGLYSLVSSIIGYLTVLDLGFGNAIIVYTAKYRAQEKYEEEKKLQGMFFVIFCIIGVMAGLLGIALHFLVPTMFANTMSTGEIEKAKIMMLILAFNLFITFIFSIYSSIISAYEKFTYQKIISILNTILKPLIMIPLLFLGYKSITLVIVITILNILVSVSNYLYCKRKLNINIKFMGFDKILFKTIFGYSFFIFLGVVVDKVNWSLDQFILGAVSGTITVSVYSVASQLNTLFIHLSTAISGVMLPKMSKMVAKQSSSKELTEEFIKVGRIQFYIIFLMVSGLVLFGKEFIMLWAGKVYGQSYYIALLLIIPLSIPLIQNLGLSITQAMNKHKFRAVSTAIMAVFNGIISLILARKYGAIGCAVGTAISLIVCNVIIMNFYYYKVIKLNIIDFWKNILTMMIKYIMLIILIICIMRFKMFDGIINIIVYGGIYTILYCIVSYLFVMNNYEKNIVNKFFIKLNLKK